MSDYSTEVTEAVDGLMGAFEEFRDTQSKRYAELKREVDQLGLRMGRPGAGSIVGTPAGSLETKAWVNYLRRGREGMDDLAEVKSLITGDDTRGGYLAPAEFVAQVLKGLVQFSPIRQAATVGSTSAGSVILPRRTATPTAVWVGETEDRTETAPAYGQLEIPISEAACYVDISQRLLEDAAVDVGAEVAGDLAQEFGRLEGEAFTIGNGVKKPLGIMSSASGVASVVNGHATTLQSDGIVSLVYALPAYYRNRGAFLMNGTTLAAVRKLKDGQNNYLWQPAFMAGQPETLLGRPVIEAIDMPDIASGAYPIAFGDWATAYRIYDKAGGFIILRDQFTKSGSSLVRFHARRRVGGQVVMAEAAKLLKMST